VKIEEARGIFSEFEILDMLGTGATSSVFSACRCGQKEIVAIKVFETPFDDEAPRLRFDRECKLLSKLSHPSIVELKEWGNAQDFPFLVLSLIEGTSLRRLLRHEGAFTPDATQRIGAALALALDHAHSASVIHRDIKPENIIIRPDGTPVLIDFGLAKSDLMQTVQTRTGLLLGTPPYMPPEIFTSDYMSNAFGDLYSLGAVLFEMITGKVAFDGSLTEIVHAKIKERAPSLLAHKPDCPPRLAKVIDGLLLSAEHRRPENARLLARALSKKGLCDQPSALGMAATKAVSLSAQAPHRPKRPIEGRRLSRRMKIASALLTLLLAAVLIVLMTHDQEPEQRFIGIREIAEFHQRLMDCRPLPSDSEAAAYVDLLHQAGRLSRLEGISATCPKSIIGFWILIGDASKTNPSRAAEILAQLLETKGLPALLTGHTCNIEFAMQVAKLAAKRGGTKPNMEPLKRLVSVFEQLAKNATTAKEKARARACLSRCLFSVADTAKPRHERNKPHPALVRARALLIPLGPFDPSIYYWENPHILYCQLARKRGTNKAGEELYELALESTRHIEPPSDITARFLYLASKRQTRRSQQDGTDFAKAAGRGAALCARGMELTKDSNLYRQLAMHHIELLCWAIEMDEAKQALAGFDKSSVPETMTWRYHLLVAQVHECNNEFKEAREKMLEALALVSGRDRSFVQTRWENCKLAATLVGDTTLDWRFPPPKNNPR